MGNCILSVMLASNSAPLIREDVSKQFDHNTHESEFGSLYKHADAKRQHFILTVQCNAVAQLTEKLVYRNCENSFFFTSHMMSALQPFKTPTPAAQRLAHLAAKRRAEPETRHSSALLEYHFFSVLSLSFINSYHVPASIIIS